MIVITVFYIWAAVQGFFLGLNILQFKTNKANWYLVIFLFLTATNILFQYILIFTEFKKHYPEYVFVSDTLGLLYGPVLYLYCRQLIYNEFETRSLIHFAPAILYTAYFLTVEIGLKAPFQFHNYIGEPAHIVTLLTICASSILYLSLSWTMIRKVRNRSKIVEFKFIFWLEALLVVLFFKTLFNITTFSLHMFIHTDTAVLLTIAKNTIFITSNSIILIGLQFMINKHPYIINKEFDLFDNDEDNSDEEIAHTKEEHQTKDNLLVDKNKEKKEGFSIPEEDAVGYLEKLAEVMGNEKPYLDAGLTEKSLAALLDIQPYVLSKLLNQHLGKRFNEYINEMRVENAKMLLIEAEEKRHTMFVISVDSGFKSESAFYNNFKKFTGCTPKAYQQKLIGN